MPALVDFWDGQALTVEEFQPIIRNLLRMYALAAIDYQAMRALLLAKKVVQAEDLNIARDYVRQEMKPILDGLEETSPQSVIDMLQKFEGPIQ